MSGGTRNQRVNLPASADDLLPIAAVVSAVKSAAIAGVTAEIGGMSWPPPLEAHALLDLAPVLALALLEAACEGVPVARLARCVGLDPLNGPMALAAARAGGEWPGRAYRAALAIMEASL